jgi:hypothetical protein
VTAGRVIQQHDALACRRAASDAIANTTCPVTRRRALATDFPVATLLTTDHREDFVNRPPERATARPAVKTGLDSGARSTMDTAGDVQLLLPSGTGPPTHRGSGSPVPIGPPRPTVAWMGRVRRNRDGAHASRYGSPRRSRLP